jgi:hypothetical protein
MPPLTLTGIILYAHRVTRNELTAQIQTAIPSDTVTNSVGTSTKSAAPIQNRMKSSAVMREKRIVPRAKEAKSARGVKERRSWMKRKDCMCGAKSATVLQLVVVAHDM